MIDLSMENGLPSAHGGATDEELLPAKDLIASFIIAMKNYALYPEDNEIVQTSVENVATRLDKLLDNYEDFRFHVKRDRLLFQDQILHQGTPDIGNIAFVLYRDAILWVEFQKGIELTEVTGFLRLVNQYRETGEESEGDLVTALWEAQFPHLRYEASDIFLDDETEVDLSLLAVTDEDHRDREQRQEEDQETIQTIADPEMSAVMWELSLEEKKELEEMILADENRDSTEGVLEVLMVILKEHVEENDLADILKFLQGTFRDLLSKVEFEPGLKLLEDLHEIRKSCTADRVWVRPMLDQFFKELSGHQVLSVLQEVWPVLEILDAHRFLLRQILLHLPPKAILTIGPMSLEVSAPSVRHELTKAIGTLANRDIEPLERLLNHRDQNLVLKMVPVLKDLEGDRPSELLLALVRNPSERIRKAALDTLMARDRQLLKEVFLLIEDDSAPVRKLMLDFMGKERNEVAEDLLLDYLEKRRFQRHDNQHLLACYRVLGRCGSARSIPFLSRTLLNRGWVPGFGRSTHRPGAATALKVLGLDEAREILDKASRSVFPSVRLACRKATEFSR
jgi:hypothetical protein